MKITKRQLRRIIREELQLEMTSYEKEVGEPSEFVEANWEPWLKERGLGVEDLDDLAHYVGAPDRSWLDAKPPANGMIGPADIERWAKMTAGFTAMKKKLNDRSASIRRPERKWD